jgi:hypothetical protein
VWLAFYLMNRDMEMSCDEMVFRKRNRHCESLQHIPAQLCGKSSPAYAQPTAFWGDRREKSHQERAALEETESWVTLAACGALCLGGRAPVEQTRQSHRKQIKTAPMPCGRELSANDLDEARRHQTDQHERFL